MSFILASCGGGPATRANPPPSTTPVAAPTLSLSVTPTSVVTGGQANLTWTSTNATSCTASGSWTGSEDVTGTQSTGPLQTNATYSLNCIGSSGSVSKSVTVTVSQPQAAPMISIEATPTSVSNGSTATLTWHADNASQCSAGGSWSGSRDVSGSIITVNLSAPTNSFVLQCSGPGGSASASANVTVSAGNVATCPTAPPLGLPSGGLTRSPQNPAVRNGPESYDDLKAGPRTILKEGLAQYSMWYEAVSSSGTTSIAYATSTDGLTWTKQGVVMEPDGQSSWEKDETSPGTILLENGVYKLWYHGGGSMDASGNRVGSARIGYATSVDGRTWTKHAANPVLDVGGSGGFDDGQVAEPRVMRVGTGYRMYFTGANQGSSQKSLGVATSLDGITWSKDTRSPILDSNRWGNFWGGAFFLENGLWQAWHADDTGSGQIKYMWSADGLSWTDGLNDPVLVTSTVANGPDTTSLGDSVSGFRDGSAYRIYYTGFAQNLGGTLGRFEGINMATVAATCPGT